MSAADRVYHTLTDAEAQFLKFAMDVAFDAMTYGDGFEDSDWNALDRFRRMAEAKRTDVA